jgi:hypothetical protein
VTGMASKPTGKAGRGHTPWLRPGESRKPNNQCCVCRGSRELRFRNGDVKPCTNC